MNELQINYIRDFALSHVRYPISNLQLLVQRIRSRSASSAEYAAANVLETVCMLAINSKEQYLLSKLEAQAKVLCKLTGETIPWLAITEPKPEQEASPPVPATEKTLQPIAGRLLSTAEAAKVLGYDANTLRKWASTQTGPIQPIRNVGRYLRWSGDEILRFLAGSS